MKDGRWTWTIVAGICVLSSSYILDGTPDVLESPHRGPFLLIIFAAAVLERWWWRRRSAGE